MQLQSANGKLSLNANAWAANCAKASLHALCPLGRQSLLRALQNVVSRMSFHAHNRIWFKGTKFFRKDPFPCWPRLGPSGTCLCCQRHALSWQHNSNIFNVNSLSIVLHGKKSNEITQQHRTLHVEFKVAMSSVSLQLFNVECGDTTRIFFPIGFDLIIAWRLAIHKIYSYTILPTT